MTLTTTTITLTSATSTVTLNTQDAAGVKWVVRQFDGWGTSHPSIQVVPKPRQRGGWAGQSFDEPRYIAVGVTLFAPTPAALNVALDQLYSAVDRDSATLTVAEAGFTRSLVVRRNADVQHSRVTNVIATVQFQVVALDPRKLGTPVTQSTALASTSGGEVIPFVLPDIINSVNVSGAVSLTNPGSATGPVVLRIDGPVVSPLVTHTSSLGQSVFAVSLTLGVGEWLLVDMDSRSALGNGQASRSRYITSRGWSGFDPGSNSWAFTATGYNTSALLTVTGTPAFN